MDCSKDEEYSPPSNLLVGGVPITFRNKKLYPRMSETDMYIVFQAIRRLLLARLIANSDCDLDCDIVSLIASYIPVKPYIGFTSLDYPPTSVYRCLNGQSCCVDSVYSVDDGIPLDPGKLRLVRHKGTIVAFIKLI